MPKNKSQSFKEQQNKSSMMEEATTLRAQKQKELPPSLNNINKNESLH